MNGYALLLGLVCLAGAGLWLTGKIWGENSTPQKVYTGLVFFGIVGFFVRTWLVGSENPVGRAIAVFALPDGRATVLRERLIQTRIRRSSESSTASDFRRAWSIDLPDGKSVELFQAENLGLTRSWHFRGTHDQLWVHSGMALMLVSLTDGTINKKLGATQAVFQPPFELHEHPFARPAGLLIVRDREDRWWKVAGDLSVQKTTFADAEFAWRGYEDDLALGCHSKRKYYEPSTTGRSRVRLTELKPRMHGAGPDKDPEGNVLNGELLRDLRAHCTVDTSEGAIVVHRQTLSEQSPVLLSLAANKDGELKWTLPLGQTCGTGRLLPASAHDHNGTLVLLFANGAVCAIKDGKLEWATDLLLKDPPLDRKGAKLLEVEWSEEAASPWISLESGALLHPKVSLASGQPITQ